MCGHVFMLGLKVNFNSNIVDSSILELVCVVSINSVLIKRREKNV